MFGCHHWGENLAKRFYGLPGQRTGGSEPSHRGRFGPGRQELANTRASGRRQRCQTFQPFQDILLVRFGPVVAAPVDFLGFQELQRVGQQRLADFGIRRPVVGVEPLCVARGELAFCNGAGQDLCVITVGARQRNQDLHRARGGDLAGNDQTLHRFRKNLDQIQSAGDPALGPSDPHGDGVQRDPLSFREFTDEQSLLQRRERCRGLTHSHPQQRLTGRKMQYLGLHQVPAQLP